MPRQAALQSLIVHWYLIPNNRARKLCVDQWYAFRPSFRFNSNPFFALHFV